MHKKLKLESKICIVCNKPFNWRKKWEKDWVDIKYCSQRCKRSKNEGKLCTLHNKILTREGKLKCGYIDEPRPKGAFPNKDPKRENIYPFIV